MPTLLLDPTIAYLMLIVGLWLAITAIYLPGTFLPEIGATVVLIGAVLALAALPTNWISLVLLVTGMVTFILLPFISPARAHWADAALVVQGIGSVFLFRGTMPNPLAIAALLAAAYIYHHFLLLPIMRRVRELPAVSDEYDNLLGVEGRVVSAVDPPATGAAQVAGEMWTIRSNIPLEPGDLVRVISKRGLELEVERLKSKRPPTPDDDEITADQNINTEQHDSTPEPQTNGNRQSQA